MCVYEYKLNYLKPAWQDYRHYGKAEGKLYVVYLYMFRKSTDLSFLYGLFQNMGK